MEIMPTLAWQRTVATTKTPIFWKVLTFALASLLVLQWLRQEWASWPEQHHRTLSKTGGHGYGSEMYREQTTGEGWSYEWKRDRNNYALSSEQCDAAFPELYYEIERAADYWSTKNISSDSVDLTMNGGARVRIVEGQLHIVRTSGMATREDFRGRILAVLHQIHRALTAAEGTDAPLEDTEFTIIVDDYPAFPDDKEMAWWSWTRKIGDRKHDALWLVPDFNFWSIPPVSGPFADMQRKAREHDTVSIVDKIQKAVWRGVTWTNPPVREALVRQTEDQPWADVQVMSWEPGQGGNKLKLEEFCDYAFLLNTEGRAWSSRLTYGLNCDSVPVVHDLEWVAHFYHLLKPGKNYLRVRRDWADLRSQIEHYLEHPDEAQMIVDEATATFRERYTTPAAGTCYWRKLLRRWAGMANTQNKDLPAIPFEEFILGGNQDFPYQP